jgi:hypothetical protein
MSKENAFLTPDIVIKTKLDSIWTDLQSNLPSIEFESNNEVNSEISLYFLKLNSKFQKDNEGEDVIDIIDRSSNNVDDDDDDFDDIKNIYSSFKDDQDLIKNGYFENFKKFINNNSTANAVSLDFDYKNESLINNNEIFIKFDKNNKINFNNNNDADQIKRAESVAKASKITKAIFDQTSSKLNMEIFNFIDIGE